MAVTAIRPNGKPYARRIRPEVLADFDMDSWGDSYLAVVTRTHDVDEAVALMWSFHGYRDSADPGYPLPAPMLRWVRQAICMCGGDHGWDLVEDSERGFPAVEFRA